MKLKSYNPLTYKLEKILIKEIKNLFNIKINSLNIKDSPNIELGHFSLNCYLLSKELKENPIKIAEKLNKNLKLKSQNDKGYLNIFIEDKDFNYVINSIKDDSFFNKNNGNNELTMIEYSQPNTHKELHVGHMRNIALGSSLINLYKYFNLNVTSSTFPGDSGAHVAKCLWYISKNGIKEPEEDKAKWLGEMYIEASQYLEKLKEERIDKKLKTQKEILIDNELSHVLDEIRNEQGHFYILWKKTRQYSIELMKKIYQWADINFDYWFYESEVDNESVNYIRDLFKENKLIEDNGAIGFLYKHSFCILLKKDGNGLYATKDILLAKKKFELGIHKNIYLVDERQKFHFEQVFHILKEIGFEHANKCEHLAYAHVELPDGPMKSREGNVVFLTDLITKMEETIQKKFNSSKEDTKKIAKGAIFYGMLKQDPNKKIIFNMEEWLKLEGNTGSYLQYSAVRTKSLLDKNSFGNDKEFIFSISSKKEKELLIKISLFNEIVKQSIIKNKPSTLCNYLFDLSKLFNSFYAESSIKNELDVNQKKTKLNICFSYFKTMKEALKLLQIDIPEKM